jgi:excisionase family DNA binding protein
MEDELLTVADVARRLKVHPETVRRWLRTGTLRGVKISDQTGYRIRASEVERLLLGAQQSPLPDDQKRPRRD